MTVLKRSIYAALPIALVLAQLCLAGESAQRAPESIELAFVANAEEGSIAIVDVAARAVIGSISVNFAEVEAEGPGAANYAQDTDVSPDGRTLYVSRGYLGDVAAFDVGSGRPLWTSCSSRRLSTTASTDSPPTPAISPGISPAASSRMT
jgi:DNA-binding beta-propeller fold protein YncE